MGNTPRVYLTTSEKPKSHNEENDVLFVEERETTKRASSNRVIDESHESKEMLEDFVHDALFEIDYGDTVDDLFANLPLENSEDVTGVENRPVIQLNIERRELIDQQDEEYRQALEADQQKDREKEAVVEFELLRREREARVPEEPQVEVDHVVVCARHLSRGIVTRAFHTNCTMQAVYDWIGSLQADPPHFGLFAMF